MQTSRNAVRRQHPRWRRKVFMGSRPGKEEVGHVQGVEDGKAVIVGAAVGGVVGGAVGGMVGEGDEVGVGGKVGSRVGVFVALGTVVAVQVRVGKMIETGVNVGVRVATFGTQICCPVLMLVW